MEKFISELMLHNDFPSGSLVIKTSKDVVDMALKKSGGSVEVATELATKLLKDPSNIYQCGLKFFLQNQIDLGIHTEALDEILTVIASIGVQ
jgi:hypothetical protein